MRTALVSGEEFGLFLERGEVLRDGDFLLAEDGRVVRVIAKPERVLDIACVDAEALARVAYHLGNRHVPVQVGACWLRIADDHVLRQMVEGLGATVVAREAAVRTRGWRLCHFTQPVGPADARRNHP